MDREHTALMVMPWLPAMSRAVSTITPLVKRLEQAGLVERRRSKIDERLVHVWLTPEGRALLARSSCLGETLVKRSGMTMEAFNAFNEQVKALLDSLAQSGDGEATPES